MGSSAAAAAGQASAALPPAPVVSQLTHAQRERYLHGFMRHVEFCNSGAEPAARGEFVPLRCGQQTVGFLRPGWAARLAAHADVFIPLAPGAQPSAAGLQLHPSLDSQDKRTAAVARVLRGLQEEGEIEGWRGELYPASLSFHDEPAFLIERAAAPHFGVKAYGGLWRGERRGERWGGRRTSGGAGGWRGRRQPPPPNLPLSAPRKCPRPPSTRLLPAPAPGVHINGYVVLPDGSMELWVARRSRSKPTWPGRLDHIAAGGQPAGLGCQAGWGGGAAGAGERIPPCRCRAATARRTSASWPPRRNNARTPRPRK